MEATKAMLSWCSTPDEFQHLVNMSGVIQNSNASTSTQTTITPPSQDTPPSTAPTKTPDGPASRKRSQTKQAESAV
jgi:hypothetical protein